MAYRHLLLFGQVYEQCILAEICLSQLLHGLRQGCGEQQGAPMGAAHFRENHMQFLRESAAHQPVRLHNTQETLEIVLGQYFMSLLRNLLHPKPET